MHFTNDVLFWVTLLASLSLLATLQQRRLVKRLAVFFVLLVFYVLRSAALMIGVKALDRAAYVELASAMSLVDLGLQLTLAYSLVRSLTRLRLSTGVSTARSFRDSAPILFAIAILGAGALTVAMVSAVPVHSAVPLDRTIVFSGFVFLLLLLLGDSKANSPEGRVLVGFCIVGAANILAQYGRTAAAAEHNARLFLACAYGDVAVWTGALVFWILRLQSTGGAAASAVSHAPMQMKLHDSVG
jgi:hypothetical protein